VLAVLPMKTGLGKWNRREPSNIDKAQRVSCEAGRVGYGAPVKCWEIIADNLSEAG
jgi:hypothetical protein